MYSHDFEVAFHFVESHEDNYISNVNDKKKSKFKGITQEAYDKYSYDKRVESKDVKYLSEDEVREFYRISWDNYNCEKLSFPLNVLYFDSCINIGEKNAVYLFQKIFKTDLDGVLSENLVLSINSSDISNTALHYYQERVDSRYVLSHKNPSLKMFMNTWLKRDNDLKDLAVQILSSL